MCIRFAPHSICFIPIIYNKKILFEIDLICKIDYLFRRNYNFNQITVMLKFEK